MLSYVALGDYAAAARQYKTCEQLLRDELGVAPSPETTAIYQWLNRRQDISPPLRQLVTNLPIPLSSFIGRKQALKDLRELFSGTRLLTLVGAGGSGKTRLAIQLASDLIDAFRDGAWWVDLAPLTDAALVPQALAQALGVGEVPGQTLAETVTRFLRSKQLLLVLDNCEHLTFVSAQLASSLLGACPHLKILTTSREALGILGEAVYQVPTLALPGSRSPLPTDTLMEYEGIRLFVERARAVYTDFELTGENAAAVVQICRRLDGIPLALELAAARTQVLAVEQIAARLDHRLELLTGGNRAAPPRHQTLRAAIDWSYDLLPHHSQILFRRLSVFAGGFTLAAAEAVCSDELLPLPALFDHLARLVDQSLVIVVQLRGDARYHMLETIRQYAGEKLIASGERERVNLRHAVYFVELAEEAELKLTSAERGVWFDRLQAEDDNLRAAQEWSLHAADNEVMQQRLAGGLSWFWEQRGYVSEGRRWLVNALARPGASAATPARAKVLFGLGDLALSQGDAMESKDALIESIRLWRSFGDAGKRGLAIALEVFGWLVRGEGDPHRAGALIEESVALFRELGDTWGVAWALGGLGMALRDQDQFDPARKVLADSIALCDKLGDRWILTSVRMNLGLVAYRQGNYAEARSHFETCLELQREIGDKRQLTNLYKNLALAAMNQADDKQAKLYLAEAMALSRYLEDRFSIAEILLYQGTLAMFEDDLELADTYFQQSFPLARVTTPLWLRASVLGHVAGIAARRGQPERAARLWGAFEAGMAAAASFIDAADRRYFELSVVQARDQLGAEAFEAARAKGRAMSLELAIAYPVSTERN